MKGLGAPDWRDRAMTCMAIVIALLMLLPGMLVHAAHSAEGSSRAGAYAPWWDYAWKYRRPITIDSSKNADPLSDYQLPVNITYNSDMNGDFSDLRFVQYNQMTSQSTELAYWTQSKVDAVSAVVWAKVKDLPGGGTATVHMYYGNSAAATKSDPDSLFDFYDDFSGNSIDAAKWSIVDSSGWSVANSELKGTTTTGLLHSKITLTTGSILETRTRGVSYAGNSHNPISAWSSTADLLGFYWGYMSGGWAFYSFYADGAPTANYNWAGSQSSVIFQIVMKTDNTNDLVKRDYNTYNVLESWSQGHAAIRKTISGDEMIRMGRRCDDGYRNQGYEAYWDWVRVRRYAPSEPTYAFGERELPWKFKSLAYGPKSPNEGNRVTVNATFNNPTSDPMYLDVSFWDGEDFGTAANITPPRNVTLRPSADTMVQVNWTATGGFHRMWVSALGAPLASVNISVNWYPVLAHIPDQNLTQGKRFQLQLNATDLDGEVLTWSASTSLFQLTVASNRTAEISYTPSNDDVGSYIITITVKDTHSCLDSQAVLFTVKNVNDPPTIDPIPDLTATEHLSFTYQVNAFDPDIIWGDALKFTDDTDLFTINRTSGRISFTPTEAQVGVHDVMVVVTDNRSSSASSRFKLTVANVNDPPALDPIPPQTAWQGRPFRLLVNATDPDLASDPEEKLRFSDDSPLFNIDGGTGLINFTPTNDQLGMRDANITVTDRGGLASTARLRMTVLNTNDPPAIGHMPDQTATEDQPFRFQASATDPDLKWGLDNLTFSDSTDLFDIEPGTGVMAFVPTGAQVGAHQITITVTDEHGAQASASFTLTVVHVNHPPFGASILSPANGTRLKEGTVLLLVGMALDPDPGDDLEFSWLDNGEPLGTGDNLSVKLTPGKHLIIFEASDGKNATRTEVNVEVTRKEQFTVADNWWMVAVAAAVAGTCLVVGFMVARKARRPREAAAPGSAAAGPAPPPLPVPSPTISRTSPPAPSAGPSPPKSSPKEASRRDEAQRTMNSTMEMIAEHQEAHPEDIVDVSAALENLDIARQFFKEGDYDEALVFARDAEASARKLKGGLGPPG